MQNLFAHPGLTRFAISLSRRMPPGPADRLASMLAGAVCRVKPNVYWVVRANVGQVLGEDACPDRLERTIRTLFYSAIRNYYYLFHTLDVPREEMAAAVEFPQSAQEIAQAVLGTGRGTVLVVPHLGNFDLLAHTLGTYTSPIQILSLPNPPAGFQVMNEVRRLSGVELAPLSPAALRRSIQILRAGGVVAIAADRSVSDLDQAFPFFGRPTRLPSGYVRLALKTGATVVVGCCVYRAETRRYYIHLEPPVELQSVADTDEEIRVNVRHVLSRMEAMIRRWPEQWVIFVPVWPELVKAGR